MRTVNLATVGAKAEALRLRQMASRTVFRVAFGAIAAFFAIATIVSLHVAGALYLATVMQPIYAALVVAAIDLLIAAIFGLIAVMKGPGRIEREALQIRLAAQAQLREAVALTAVVGPLARLLGGRKLYAVTLAALTARYLGGSR
jgi:hypothetical protein